MSDRLLILLLVALLSQTGCTQSVLGVLLAPEAVVGGAANSLASTGAEAISATSVSRLSSQEATQNEIDRFLKENPDAPNADRLRELQESMRGTPKDTGVVQRQMTKELPPPRRPMDKKLPVRKGDLFSISTPSSSPATRRPPMRPNTQPTAATLKPENQPIHTMSLYPIRVQ
jgi:hypothetical protein